MSQTYKYACFRCRLVASRQLQHGPVKCQGCSRKMESVGHDFRAPRKRDNRGWTEARALAKRLRARYRRAGLI